MHEKKEKGDMGVVFAITRLTELGWSVCIPIKEHKKYDLIAEKDGICKTIQVRYTTPKNGKLEIKLANSWADRNGSHTTSRKYGDFDVLAAFCPTTRIVYFVEDEDFNNERSISLRLEPSKNNQKKNVRMASDFVNLN